MKAGFLIDKNRFECREVPTPTIAEGETLLRVSACGFCGSDIHDAARGCKEPKIPGHEFAGVVEEIRGDARGFKKGDAAVINPLMTCGTCEYCVSGREHLCHARAVIGCQTPGGFAQFAKVPTDRLRRIPKGLKPEYATLSDPLAVTMHACDLAGDLKGKNVLVYGAGTLGLFMVQMLKRRGAAKVVVSDVAAPRLKAAAKMSATLVVDASRDPEYASVKDIVFDVTVELAGGQAPTLGLAIDRVRRGGLVLLVAQRPPTEIKCAQLLFNERRLQGVFGQTSRNFDDALALLATGKVNADAIVTDLFPLERIQEAFDRARSTDSVKVVVKPS